jgi:hypothetical protein
MHVDLADGHLELGEGREVRRRIGELKCDRSSSARRKQKGSREDGDEPNKRHEKPP